MAQALVTLAQLDVTRHDYVGASQRLQSIAQLSESLEGTDIQIQSQWISGSDRGGNRRYRRRHSNGGKGAGLCTQSRIGRRTERLPAGVGLLYAQVGEFARETELLAEGATAPNWTMIRIEKRWHTKNWAISTALGAR